jgi:hypothetical protein
MVAGNFVLSSYSVLLPALLNVLNVRNVVGTTYSIDYYVLQKFWLSTGGRNWDYPDNFGRAHWQFVPSCHSRCAALLLFGTPYELSCEYLPPCDPGSTMSCYWDRIEWGGAW